MIAAAQPSQAAAGGGAERREGVRRASARRPRQCLRAAARGAAAEAAKDATWRHGSSVGGVGTTGGTIHHAPCALVRDVDFSSPSEVWRVAATHARTFKPERAFPTDQLAVWERYHELYGSTRSPAGTYLTLAAFPVPEEEGGADARGRPLPGVAGTVWSALDGSLGGDVCGAATLDDTAASMPRRRDGTRRRRIAYIANVAVRERWRRKGVGAALVHAAEERATQWGFRAVALHVDSDNPSARKFYENLGYRKIETPPNAKNRVMLFKWLHPLSRARRGGAAAATAAAAAATDARDGASRDPGEVHGVRPPR